MKYTDEQRSFIIKEYTTKGSDIIPALADSFTVSVRSIIAVLARAKVYKRQEYTPKYGETVYSKEEIVSLIEAEAKVTATSFEGLEKAPKYVLFKILDLLQSGRRPDCNCAVEEGQSPSSTRLLQQK